MIPSVSCGFSRQSGSAGSDSAFEPAPIENSGRRLSGIFLLSKIEDQYRDSNKQSIQQTQFSFDDSGNFKRQDKSRVEEGTYLITSQGEMLIYIEKINAELLTTARVERYTIIGEGADSLMLGSSPSRKLLLRRQ